MPRRLLPALLREHRLLLCLDYDGTLSEITARPADARPVAHARAVIRALTRHPERIAIAIISGRDLGTLRALLKPEGRLWMVGSHGIEMLDPDGERHLQPAAGAARSELAKLRAWMKRKAPPRGGFVIEDKRVAIALHYRNAKPGDAAVVRAALRDFIAARCASVTILHGKMVDEVLPRGLGGKGAAVRRIQKLLGAPVATPVYFGDDVTDEDAFRELREDGVTVRVGAAEPSWAQYRIESPAMVVAVLRGLVAALVPARRI
ncbi:MAG TPA: trehalose-phosphatase [Candidatus Binataceae bacterium]|nr:trehalose-phosphatase [Candidatus Binataceae bacterium]